LDTDYPDEIEKENGFNWAGTDYQKSIIPALELGEAPDLYICENLCPV
jgi:hypothetical protein